MFGFVEYQFLANSILVGVFGNSPNRAMNGPNPGQVAPEMAMKVGRAPGLAGDYHSYWMDENGKPVPSLLRVTDIGNVPNLAFSMEWFNGDQLEFKATATLLTPDRLVGYYI